MFWNKCLGCKKASVRGRPYYINLGMFAEIQKKDKLSTNVRCDESFLREHETVGVTRNLATTYENSANSIPNRLLSLSENQSITHKLCTYEVGTK